MSVSIGHAFLVMLFQERIFVALFCISEHTLSLGAAKAALQHPAVLCLQRFCVELSREGHGGVAVFLLFCFPSLLVNHGRREGIEK